MADVAAKTAKSDITKRSDVLRFAGKLLSVFFVVALLCAVLPTRATGEEPALFRASLMYNDTTNAAGSTILSTDCGDPAAAPLAAAPLAAAPPAAAPLAAAPPAVTPNPAKL